MRPPRLRQTLQKRIVRRKQAFQPGPGRSITAPTRKQDGPLMTRTKITPEEALAYHLEPRPGKYDVVASTPMATQRDLSLAYSPGVAVPVQAIADDPSTAYDYTVKGNMVAV